MKEKLNLDENGIKQVEEILNNLHKKINENNIIKSEAIKDAPGDGWHDNFAAEDAARVERLLLEELKKIKIIRNNIHKISEKNEANKVNLLDKIKIKLTYSQEDTEILEIKVTGNYMTKEENEVTINSALGKAIYKKEYKSKGSYYVGDKEIFFEILERIK